MRRSLEHDERAPGHLCAGGQRAEKSGMASGSSLTGRGREGGYREWVQPEASG